jgi:hypothetical protein
MNRSSFIKSIVTVAAAPSVLASVPEKKEEPLYPIKEIENPVDDIAMSQNGSTINLVWNDYKDERGYLTMKSNDYGATWHRIAEGRPTVNHYKRIMSKNHNHGKRNK